MLGERILGSYNRLSSYSNPHIASRPPQTSTPQTSPPCTSYSCMFLAYYLEKNRLERPSTTKAHIQKTNNQKLQHKDIETNSRTLGAQPWELGWWVKECTTVVYCNCFSTSLCGLLCGSPSACVSFSSVFLSCQALRRQRSTWHLTWPLWQLFPWHLTSLCQCLPRYCAVPSIALVGMDTCKVS